MRKYFYLALFLISLFITIGSILFLIIYYMGLYLQYEPPEDPIGGLFYILLFFTMLSYFGAMTIVIFIIFFISFNMTIASLILYIRAKRVEIRKSAKSIKLGRKRTRKSLHN